jgi:tetratricopeptide (TPR) repeat protein
MKSPSNPINVKTFLSALKLFPHKLAKAKQFLKDKRLTQAEKVIIEGWFLLRDSKNNEVINSLQKLILNDEIVELERNLLLGIAYNNIGEFRKSLESLENCKKKLDLYPLERQSFLAYYNLFIVHFNYMNLLGMEEAIETLEKKSSGSAGDERAILFCHLCYQVMKNDTFKADELIQQLDKLESITSESQACAYQVLKFNYYIQNDNLTDCYLVLEKMKKFRKFQISSNYKFMKELMKFLTEDKSIYFYDKDFEKTPLLLWQMKVLSHLEASELDQATKAWDELIKIDPSHYKQEFRYVGRKNLFSICLEKVRPMEMEFALNLKKIQNKEDRLITILKSYEKPIRKDELYELIWEENPEKKTDFDKLKTMILKIRKSKNLDIKSKKGCYLLIAEKKKVA